MGSQESQACPGRRGESTCCWAPKTWHAPQRRLQTVQEDEVRPGDESPPAWPGQASRKAEVKAFIKHAGKLKVKSKKCILDQTLAFTEAANVPKAEDYKVNHAFACPSGLSLGCCSEREQVCVEEAV